MRRLMVLVAILAGTASAAHAFRVEREEPRQMRPGETIHLFNAACGTGYVRQVTADETGTKRTRKCVRLHLFPPEIVLKAEADKK